MSQHTPGPWMLDESRHMGCINRLEPYRHIGMVSAYQEKQGDAEENRANAHLMAAAPELLASLEYLMAIIDPHGDERHLTITLTPEYFEYARKAIAKARGVE